MYQSSMVLTEDGTSGSLALDARSLLYSPMGAGRVHGEPNVLGISRGYRCVISDSCSNTRSCRIVEFWWCLEVPGPSNVHVWRAQTCTFEGPGRAEHWEAEQRRQALFHDSNPELSAYVPERPWNSVIRESSQQVTFNDGPGCGTCVHLRSSSIQDRFASTGQTSDAFLCLFRWGPREWRVVPGQSCQILARSSFQICSSGCEP